MSDYQKRFERLQREIKNQAANVANGAQMRHDHPSYGYTKTGNRAELVKLEGMLLAWLVLGGYWTYAGHPVIRDLERTIIKTHLDIDVVALSHAVES